MTNNGLIGDVNLLKMHVHLPKFVVVVIIIIIIDLSYLSQSRSINT